MAWIRVPMTLSDRGRPSLVVVLVWSFLEATLFFVVVDVCLSSIAMSDRRRALRLCGFAAISATIGGAILFWMGWFYPAEMRSLLSGIPAIDFPFITEVDHQVTLHSYRSMFVGAFTGVPYKIFAVLFGERYTRSVDFFIFLVASLCARYLRFSFVVLVASMVGHYVRRVSPGAVLVTHLAFWVLFYLCYWMV